MSRPRSGSRTTVERLRAPAVSGRLEVVIDLQVGVDAVLIQLTGSRACANARNALESACPVREHRLDAAGKFL